MRIHRVALRNYRGVDEAEVEFATEGVTIIEGDNEVGKTSFSEAIDMVLEVRDDSNKQAVKAIKPVDRDVGAEVEIEFTSGPYRLRYRKRWHRQKETVLDILEPERSQLTGRDAHDRVRAILDETLDAGLWDALRLRQGRELEQAAFAGGSLGRALDLAVGGESAGDREDDLWARLSAERDRYWTATGQPKVERSAAASRLEEAEQRVADLEVALADVQDDAEQVERLTLDAAALIDKQQEHERQLEVLEAQVDAVRAQRADIERLAGQRETALADRDRAAEVARTRSDLVERVAAEGSVVAVLESSVAAARPARTEIDERRRVAQEALDSARHALRDAEAVHRRALEDRDYRRQQIELAQLSERLERVSQATGERAAAAARLETIHVDDELVERIERAQIDVVRAEASADVSAPLVEATALGDVGFRVDDDHVELTAGQHHRVRVVSSVHLEVPGVVAVSVTAGTEGQALAERLTEAREALSRLCAEGRVSDAGEARQQLVLRTEVERVLTDTAATIARDRRDLTADDLAQKVERLTARVSGYEPQRPADPPIPADLDAAQSVESDWDGRVGELRSEVSRLEAEVAAVAADVQSADIGDAEAKARLDQARRALDQAEQSLTGARNDASDDDIAGRLEGAESVLSARSAELAEAEARLAADDPETAEALLDNARAVRTRLAAEVRDNEMRTRELRVKLAVKGDEGLANQLDVASSDLHRVGLEHARLEARAAAAERLYDTFAVRRAEAHHRYVAPFRDRIVQLGRLVFDRGFDVELDDELRIARRTLDGVTLDFDDLSTGAQEQLGIIGRLACASLVAADGGAPVIFDDALGWSDPGRLDRMGAVIATAGRGCQIIVLTCTPGRYESVGNATVVHLRG